MMLALQPKVIMAGAPAAGKGTQCGRLVRDYGVVQVSPGDILREEKRNGTVKGKKAQSYMDSGELVPDELVVDMVLERLEFPDAQRNGWLLDGFPRSKCARSIFPSQMTIHKITLTLIFIFRRGQCEEMKKRNINPTSFVVLDVPTETLVERVSGRRLDPETGKVYHLKFSPPESEDIKKRLEQVCSTRTNTNLLSNGYLIAAPFPPPNLHRNAACRRLGGEGTVLSFFEHLPITSS